MSSLKHPHFIEETTMMNPSYCSDILSRFTEFRNEGLFCDFTLKVGKVLFKVHKMVMAGCFDYFRAMFSHGMLESHAEEFEINDFSLHAVQTLINYAYSGKLNLSLQTMPDLLAVASFFQSPSALDLCTTYLKIQMSFENMEQIINMASTYGLMDICKHQRFMVLERFNEYAETYQFLSLDAATLMSYLASDSLRISSELKLLKYVLRWYEHDPENRESCVHEVLDYIRYTLEGWPCIDYACNQEVFKKNKKCQEIMEAAFDYMKNAPRNHLMQSHRTKVRFDRKTLVQIGGTVMNYDEDLLEMGNGENHYFHDEIKGWQPLGILHTMDYRDFNHIVEVNDFGIMIGGYVYTQNNQSLQRHATKEVHLFCPGSTGFAYWELSDLNTPRSRHCVVYEKHKGLIYAIGGHNDHEVLSSVEEYNLEQDRWTFTKPLSKPLCDHAGAAYGGKVFVTGGLEAGNVSNKLLCFHRERKKWEEKTPMMTFRYRHSMIEFDGQLIVCGGRPNTHSLRCLNSVEGYSVNYDQWTFLTPMRLDCCSMTPVVLNDRLLIVGGENSVGDFLPDIQQYDPTVKAWGFYCDLPFPMKNVGCVAVTVKLSDNPDRTHDCETLLEEVERWNILNSPDAYSGESDEG